MAGQLQERQPGGGVLFRWGAFLDDMDCFLLEDYKL